MRWLMKSLVSLILIVILFIIVIYAFVQTQWGAQKTSEWLTQYSDYDVRFSGIEHNFTQPEQVTIHELSINQKQNKTTLVANSAQLKFNWQSFLFPTHLQKITLENGKIVITDKIAALPISADILQFKNMTLQSAQSDITFSAEKITGGITPWQPTAENSFGSGHFQFSIANGHINDNLFNHFIISGEYQPNHIQIDKLGTQLLNGSLSFNGQYQNNRWTLNDVYMNGIRWQSTKTLSELIQSMKQTPAININSLNIVDLTAEGKQWAISGFDGQFSQLEWDKTFSVSRGELNADDIVINDNHMTDLIAKLDQQNDHLNVDNLSLRYEKGIIKLSGYWNKADKTLAIKNATLSGILYTLPKNWLSFFAEPIDKSSNIENINIEKLSISQSILIDISPDFPFQFTGLAANIQNLMVAKNGEWGLWQGTATFNADSGTLNRIELRRPDLTIETQQDKAIAKSFSAFVDSGLIQGAAVLDQANNQRHFSLIANGLNVPLSVPNSLGWRTPSLTENGKFTLKIKGELRANPISSTLNGSLCAQQEGQILIDETMSQGEITDNL
ncbi:AsmA family protein [Proteus myxofaciens]|uniref:AsmA family protein n=1 Tax=Proteus myxofaciens TaxID=184072 RepID=UPI00082CDFFF|nr:AsmA family protein [Proteus myxofaciens]